MEKIKSASVCIDKKNYGEDGEMKRFVIVATSCLLLFIYTLNFIFCGGFYTKSIRSDAIECYTGPMTAKNNSAFAPKKNGDGIEVGSRLLELLFGKDKREADAVMLYPGGGVFGVHIVEDGVTVMAGSESKAFRAGDRIIGVEGVSVGGITDIENAVKTSDGKRISFDIIRGGEKLTVSTAPISTSDGYRLGLKLRAQTAGIGTITYVIPETLNFGGLGHGVSDSETGAPVSIRRGEVKTVMLGGCKRGESGKAGELAGVLKKDCFGNIRVNCECGVFGTLNSLPDYCSDPLPAANRSEIKCGPAEIISTVKNGYREKYTIEISDIDTTSTGSKSFRIKVTDPTLIAITGGIVRGMSGSPIIQNGKLVGAVTHVLVANPTEGYGIFIENMLNAAQMPMAKAS